MSLIGVLDLTGPYVALIFHLCFIFTITFLILSTKDLIKIFKGISKKTWFILILIMILGLFIRINASPFTDSFNSVGWPYMTSAYELSKSDITDYIHTNFSIGYPLIISLFYRFSGLSDILVYKINIIFGTLNIFLIFLLMYILFKKEKIALLTSLFFALDFNIINLAVRTGAHSIFFFFIILSLIFMFLTIYTKNKKFLITTVFLFSFTHYIRYEFLLVSFLVVLFMLFFAKIKIPKRQSLLLMVIFLILMIPTIILITITYGMVNEAVIHDINKQGILSPDIFTVSKVFYSLPFFLSSYFNILSWDSSKTSIGILLIPFILGIYFFFKQKYYIKYKFQLVFLTVWFILQNSIYIASRLGSRYLGFAYLPFLIIASFLIYIGIDNISRLINHKIQLRTKISKNTIFLILTLIFFSSTIYSALSMDKIKFLMAKSYQKLSIQ